MIPVEDRRELMIVMISMIVEYLLQSMIEDSNDIPRILIISIVKSYKWDNVQDRLESARIVQGIRAIAEKLGNASCIID